MSTPARNTTLTSNTPRWRTAPAGRPGTAGAARAPRAAGTARERLRADRRRHAERLCIRSAATSTRPASTSPARKAPSPTSRRTIAAARAAGMLVVFLQNGWDAAYVEAGGPGSPNWHKSNALKTMRAQPELAGQVPRQGRLGLRTHRRDEAAARRHRRAQDALQRLLQQHARQHRCARAASATWCSPASPPTCASNRRCATPSTSNTSP